MPYGFSSADFAAPSVTAKPATEFDPADGNLHFVYAGALLPKAHVVLEKLLEGLALLRASNDPIAERIRLHFIGTGKSPNDRQGYNVLPIAERLGVAAAVSEHPHRMGYLDVLAHLNKCHAPFIIGSTEAHYTPSKVFQSVQSRRPVLALLHEASTAVGVLQSSGAGVAVTLNEARLPTADEVAAGLLRVATMPYDAAAVNWQAFEAYSARESARVMAAAIDEAIARWNARAAMRATA